MKHILHFLKALKKNNHRAWMENNKSEYLEAKEVFHKIVKELISGIVLFDAEAGSADPSKCIFRINRDIRFSKDKRPYKENFGAFITRGGKNAGLAGYYLHIQPGDESFVAGGIYMPDGEKLKKIRQEIDYNPEALTGIIKNKNFKKYFGGISGEKLLRAPQGYSEDHLQIELLKHKSYIVVRSFPDVSVTDRKFTAEVLKTFRSIKPLNDFLNLAILEG